MDIVVDMMGVSFFCKNKKEFENFKMRKAFAFVASMFAAAEMASATSLRPRDFAPDFNKVKSVKNKEFIDVSL